MGNRRIAQPKAAQFALRQLTLERAEAILLIVPGKFTARDNPFQCVVVGTESNANWHNFKMTLEPKPANFLQRDILADPMASRWRLRLSSTPGAFGKLLDWFQQGGFWMHEEQTSPPAGFSHGLYAAAIGRIENANLSVVHECMPLHEFKQMRFDMRSDDAVGLDHSAGL
jgi:hypothetical protein